MIVQCKACGERVGEHEASSGIGCMMRIGVLVVIASGGSPLIKAFSRHTPWEQFWPWLLVALVAYGFLAFALLFPGYWSWLFYTLTTSCPQCGRRRWTKGVFSGFGL